LLIVLGFDRAFDEEPHGIINVSLFGGLGVNVFAFVLMDIGWVVEIAGGKGLGGS
jgi:hypothetical protein